MVVAMDTTLMIMLARAQKNWSLFGMILAGFFQSRARGVEGYGCQADGGDGKQEPDGPGEDGCYDWPACLKSSQHSGKLSGQHYGVPPKLFQAKTIGASR